MASLRLILLLENYWEDGWPVRKDVERTGIPCPAPHGVYNGLPPAIIPYAKEIFWMSKYQQVTEHARTTDSATRSA
ncbi:hypothetical protein EAO72_32145 [Streptomyces sp. or43]|nr:hypothetical protein EAO72_32145 [Streptomyces sp. or43]